MSLDFEMEYFPLYNLIKNYVIVLKLRLSVRISLSNFTANENIESFSVEKGDNFVERGITKLPQKMAKGNRTKSINHINETFS